MTNITVEEVNTYDGAVFDMPPPDPRKVIRIRADHLRVVHDAQRETRRGRAIDIAHAWRWELCEVLTVVAVGDGTFRVVEGQTRATAAQLIDGALKLWCVVLPDEYSGIAVEADTGLTISTGRVRHDAYDQWEMRVVRGDAHELAATAVLRAHGLHVSRTGSAQGIAAVQTIKTMIHARKQTPELGADLLDKTIAVLMSAYPDHDPFSRETRFDHRLLAVVAEVIVKNDHIKLDRLASKLRTLQAAQWVSNVLLRNGQKRNDVLGVNIVNTYNYNLRGNAISW